MSMGDNDILHDIQRSDPFKTSIKVGVGNFKSIALNNHNNMTDTNTTVKKTRTPRSLESITNGALSLPLEDRVKLVKDIHAANLKEVETLQTAAANASNLLNAKQP